VIKKIYSQSEGWLAAVELYARSIRETGSLNYCLEIPLLFKEIFSSRLTGSEALSEDGANIFLM
jgi:hypothetical protein